ncbi:MAG TPA: glycosyltransferase family 4 protein [Bryobacteraceae bacterium]|nr:glycosyltransferase family 4 protein [Bryobacteraceae bacterium]
MRVTFVMDGGDNLSGGHRHIAIFADGLRRRGHSVFLLARPQRPPGLRDRIRSVLKREPLASAPKSGASHFRDLGVPLNILPRWVPVGNADLPDADVVVATWWETVDWVWELAPSKGVKVHLMQDYEIWGGRIDEVDRSCARPIPKIVTSPWLPEFLATQFHQKTLALAEPGVSHTVFHAEPREKQSVPTFGMIYSDVPRKGSDISIEAVRLARQTVPEIRLVAAGSMQVSKHLPLPAGTYYEPYASDEKLRDLYRQCDAWLFGTRREGFGFPILEAMACRTPVIGTPAGAAPKLLRNGAGILTNAEDPQEMARAILKICRLSGMDWKAMSDTAAATAASYTWDDSVDKFEAALKPLVGHSGD